MGEKNSYINVRGYKTEQLVKEIIIEWADANGFIYSKQAQTKVGPRHRLELVCGQNKKIGIDITNSKLISSVERKWKKKQYHKYVDELWIFVVSDKWREDQYDKWNQESPENVFIMPYYKIEVILNGINKSQFPLKIPPEKKRRMDALAKCTYDNREEIIEKFLQKKRLRHPQKQLQDFFEEYENNN